MSSKELFYFQPQPDFPAEDINDTNTPMAEHYLKTAPERDAYLDSNLKSLALLHDIGNAALAEAGFSPGNTRSEYNAFCRGYTSINYLANLLESRPFTQLASGGGMGFFYLQHGDLADYELARRNQTWWENHPNTIELLLADSSEYKETPKACAARIIGAQVASELLYVK